MAPTKAVKHILEIRIVLHLFECRTSLLRPIVHRVDGLRRCDGACSSLQSARARMVKDILTLIGHPSLFAVDLNNGHRPDLCRAEYGQVDHIIGFESLYFHFSIQPSSMITIFPMTALGESSR
jgi:hypothetical protein